MNDALILDDLWTEHHHCKQTNCFTNELFAKRWILLSNHPHHNRSFSVQSFSVYFLWESSRASNINKRLTRNDKHAKNLGENLDMSPLKRTITLYSNNANRSSRSQWACYINPNQGLHDQLRSTCLKHRWHCTSIKFNQLKRQLSSKILNRSRHQSSWLSSNSKGCKFFEFFTADLNAAREGQYS